MTIRFIRRKNGKEIVNDLVKNKVIIKNCFEFCIKSVKKRVDNFLNNNSKQLTLHFGNETIVLKRED